jgi:hypothetical protein
MLLSIVLKENNGSHQMVSRRNVPGDHNPCVRLLAPGSDASDFSKNGLHGIGNAALTSDEIIDGRKVTGR